MHVLLEICHILFAFYTIELKVSTIFASFKMDFVQMSLTDWVPWLYYFDYLLSCKIPV